MQSSGDRPSWRTVVIVYTERFRASVTFSELVCFNKIFHCWHAVCVGHVMLKIQLHNHDASAEPAPSFASDAEIELAEQLRHQLEERYLGVSAAPPPLQERSGEVY